MAYCWLFCVLFLCFNFCFCVSIQAETVSDFYDEPSEEVPRTISNHSQNIQPINNHLDTNTYNYDWYCDCGDDSTGCSWSNGEKTCFCKEGFAQNMHLKCQRCDCGPNSIRCSFKSWEQICNCRNGYADKWATCEKCDCGGDTDIGCTFERGVKKCHCDPDEAQRDGKCEECDCGRNSNGCQFEIYTNKKFCSCYENYKQNRDGECEECDCGYNAESCEFKGRLKSCNCKQDYIYYANSGKCERCYCGTSSVSCKLTFDKYTRCTCYPGYVAERTTWEMDEECTLPGSSGWRIATYIESIIFGIIIVICVLHICCKRMSSE